MNETINNEIEMENIETMGIDMDNVIPLNYEVCTDGSGDEGNLGAIIFGAGALAAAVIGGIAIAKKKKNSDKKEGFFKKMAVKYLTKNGYVVERVDETDDEENDDDDCDGLIPDKK